MQKLVLMSLITTLTFSSHAYANWWEKGLEVLKESTTQTDSSSPVAANSSVFGNTDIESAFREALSIGSETVINSIGVENGFNLDPKIHIPLPSSLKTIQSGLTKFGMGTYADELELTLNRAAEEALPETKAIFLEAIKSMSFEDVQKLYKGSDNSATEYLKKTTTPALKEKIAPIIDNKLKSVGAVSAYESLTQSYRQKYPFLPDVKANLQSHVMDKTLEGMFYYLGQEESKIRQEPLKYGSDLLKKVFSK